jgi:hypothetical protein
MQNTRIVRSHFKAILGVPNWTQNGPGSPQIHPNCLQSFCTPYLRDNTLHKHRFLPCRVTAIFLIIIHFGPSGLCGVGEINHFRAAAVHEQ